MSLQIETQHEQSTVLLICDTCCVTAPVPTLGERFAHEVQEFFDAHTACARAVDLTAG